jgi:hypothetical protein
MGSADRGAALHCDDLRPLEAGSAPPRPPVAGDGRGDRSDAIRTRRRRRREPDDARLRCARLARGPGPTTPPTWPRADRTRRAGKARRDGHRSLAKGGPCTAGPRTGRPPSVDDGTRSRADVDNQQSERPPARLLAPTQPNRAWLVSHPVVSAQQAAGAGRGGGHNRSRGTQNGPVACATGPFVWCRSCQVRPGRAGRPERS